MADRASLGAEAQASRGEPRPVCACRVSTLVPNDANARGVSPPRTQGTVRSEGVAARPVGDRRRLGARTPSSPLETRNSEAQAKPAIGRVLGDPFPDGRGTP